MPSPSELVTAAFAQAQSYAADAQTKLTLFTDKLNDAIQLAPTVNLEFNAPPDPGAASIAPFVAPDDYSSTLLVSLASTLGARLAGGTGLAPSVETAIWDRARERELSTAQAAIDAVTSQCEAFGFELPPGVLNDGIRRETRGYFDKVSGLSRDIAIKQADLEQTNMQKAIEQCMAYETDLAEIINKRAMISVEEFRTEVLRFQAEVEQDVKRWEVAIKEYEAQITYIMEGQKLNTEIVRANLASLLEAGKVGAQVYAQLVASAYSLIHAQATVTAGASTQVGYNYSNQTLDQPSALTSI